MAKFERVNFLRASLSAEEVHLLSFKGFLCKWDREVSSNEEIPIPIEDATFLGHVTNARLIIELVADQIGYLSFDFADMDYLGVYGVTACWPVMKENMNGKNPAFLPHSLYRINAYTGAIVGLPAVAEFAEVIRDRGVRSVTYASHAT